MKKILTIIFISILISGNIFLFSKNNDLKKEVSNFKKAEEIKKKEAEKIKNNREFFGEKFSKKNYSTVKFKITDEGKKIIKNIRELHKSPVLISEEFLNKELCAGYIWNLSQKIGGKKSVYSIGLLNTKTKKTAAAWEIPHFYEVFGGEIIADFSKKFSLSKKDYLEKISEKQMKDFFAKAFLEKALLGDIGFLYKDTKHLSKLESWNYNSHITKNMGISEFEIILSNFDEKKSNLENLMENMACQKDFFKYKKLLENYKFFLSSKQIVFYNDDFYFIENNVLGEKVKFKFNDKIVYKDITLAHFFHEKARVQSLLQMTCEQVFLPINIMSINARLIEKK